jgi:hypothetical protein
MNTSIVIPLGTGSRWNNTELRYCLRSIEKHITGYGDIFIIGEYPSWLQNCVHIPATDIEQSWAKERNIYAKIMLACNDDRVTEDFLFMNDDHFLLKDYVAGEFPYYWDSVLNEYMTITQYKYTVNNTLHYVHGALIGNFDVHAPIVYNKNRFKEAMAPLDWSIKFGYCIKSMYCDINGIIGTKYPDLKLKESLPYEKIIHQIAGRPWFSIGDAARQGDLLQVLNDLYSIPSKYEKS